MTEPVLTLLTQMLGTEVGLGAEPVTGAEDLHADEAVAIANAVPRRKAEFAAGRRAARKALAEIGRQGMTLPVGPDRAPVWPAGTSGSITHDGSLALAAAVSLDVAQAIGIDLTEAAPLPEGVREQVLRHPDEADLSEIEARAVFSAKETIFKTLSPRVGQVFGFSAAVVRPDFEMGTFEARLVHPLGPLSEGKTWFGRVALWESLLITSLVLRPGDA